MFDNIEQGVEVYKNTVRKLLEGLHKIHEREERLRKEGCLSDFRTKNERDWEEQTNEQLRGMEAALGLNWGEVKEIRSIIEQDLLARTGS